MTDIDKKIVDAFIGKVVRKDLTKQLKGNAVVPSYVLEYLLSQHCATDDEAIISSGLDRVKDILNKNYVQRGDAQLIQASVREKGTYTIIDKVSVRLNDKLDQYEATFSNLGLKNIPISDLIVNDHKKLLSSGVWSILRLEYVVTDEKYATPWVIASLKPVQISNVEIKDYKESRAEFTTSEWMDLMLQTMGLNPEIFSFRSKLIQLSRLIPFVENNYNLIELGPKGTGKSHVYSELSPHGILISGGEVSKAKLFVNNSSKTGDIGLVGYWDVIAYDEFAGKTKKTDRGLVDIMKNYMANKSFSRGTEIYSATASMVFVGNTDQSVQHMMNHTNLFTALPKDYYDTAFLDRIHAYIPGWEVEKLRNEMFSEGYGFVVDYLAEILKDLRKDGRSNEYAKYFELSNSITTRDKDAIAKTFSGLFKIIYPDGVVDDLDELSKIFEFCMECRRRVKLQLQKMDETFEEVDFSYKKLSEDTYKEVVTLEEINYLGNTDLYHDSNLVFEETEEEVNDKEIVRRPLLKAKDIEIEDGQVGISYKRLFGDYFYHAKKIEIIDPYIRHPYQKRNLVELINLILMYKSPDDKISIKLITDCTEEYLEKSQEDFETLRENLEKADVEFEFEFDKFTHDRYIYIDDTWKIKLGLGLDIWTKTNGILDIAEMNQLYRKCKKFSVTILEQGKLSSELGDD